MDRKLTHFVGSITLSILFIGAIWQFSTAAHSNYPKVLLSQQSYQETLVSLSSKELNRPLYLEIATFQDTKLTGKVLIEEQTIAKLENNLNIDLSSELHPGKNTIEIIGSYEPKSNSVTVTVKSEHTQSTTSRNGIVQQKLILKLKEI